MPTRKPSTMEYGHPLLKIWQFASKSAYSGRIPYQYPKKSDQKAMISAVKT